MYSRKFRISGADLAMPLAIPLHIVTPVSKIVLICLYNCFLRSMPFIQKGKLSIYFVAQLKYFSFIHLADLFFIIVKFLHEEGTVKRSLSLIPASS